MSTRLFLCKSLSLKLGIVVLIDLSKEKSVTGLQGTSKTTDVTVPAGGTSEKC